MDKKEKQTPSRAAKKVGLKSLKEMAQLVGVKVRTLDDLYNKNRQHFDALKYGALCMKYISGKED